MGVYNDMAHDGGEAYGTEGNRQLAEMIEADHMRELEEERRAIEEEALYYAWLEDVMLQDAYDSDAHPTTEGESE